MEILPIYSGYRQESTLTRVITTEYFDAALVSEGNVPSKQVMRESSIFIPLAEIVSIRKYVGTSITIGGTAASARFLNA